MYARLGENGDFYRIVTFTAITITIVTYKDVAFLP